MSRDELYQDGMTERRLAKMILDYVYPDCKPSIPIDPFHILRHLGVVYQFMDFDKLEGIYIFPDGADDIPLVGINYNRPIVRKRYSAAHELCHHLKDKFTTVDESFGYSKDPKEQFAENFAAELLMPYDQFREDLNSYEGLLSLEEVLRLSVKYGVSFSSCVYRVAWTFHKLDGETDSRNLKKRIRNFKPKKREEELGLSNSDFILESQAFDSYEFYYFFEKEAFWIRFKNFITYNENRLEGLDISQSEVDEIFSKIRIKGFDNIKLDKLSRDMIEVLGHADMYNFIFNTADIPDIFSILKLNRINFSHAPYSQEAGSTRKNNKFITGSSAKISNPGEIVSDLMEINILFKETMENRVDLSYSEYIYKLSRIHHRITQIHPFEDGNGRSSRALFNWAIKLKNLPPFYIEVADKDTYYEALAIADDEDDIAPLSNFIINQIFKSSIRINKQDIKQLTNDD